MKCAVIISIVFFTASIHSQVSVLDNYIKPFRLFRITTIRALKNAAENPKNFEKLRYNSKLQVEVSNETAFPCQLNNTRSTVRPTSVHKLRPGDIDVVGAIGDSITAGFGLFATNIFQVLLENRGAAFSMGGEATWRKYITLPNILKEFNPNLIGYSLGSSLSIERKSQFNVAEGGSISDNTPYMAKILVKRILHDPRVNLKHDWKMITVMIGPNDFCSEMCYYNTPEVILEKHKSDMLQVLRTLRDYLPRTIVNLIPSFNAVTLRQIKKKPPTCYISHSFECPCVFGLAYESRLQRHEAIIVKWQQIDIEISNYPEFHTEDFTVVIHPFAMNITVPLDRDGNFDLSVLSADCFHFSQKGQAVLASSLWNNLMEPVGKKSLDSNYHLLETFNCPTKENPYIYTNKNSNSSSLSHVLV